MTCVVAEAMDMQPASSAVPISHITQRSSVTEPSVLA